MFPIGRVAVLDPVKSRREVLEATSVERRGAGAVDAPPADRVGGRSAHAFRNWGKKTSAVSKGSLGTEI